MKSLLLFPLLLVSACSTQASQPNFDHLSARYHVLPENQSRTEIAFHTLQGYIPATSEDDPAQQPEAKLVCGNDNFSKAFEVDPAVTALMHKPSPPSFDEQSCYLVIMRETHGADYEAKVESIALKTGDLLVTFTDNAVQDIGEADARFEMTLVAIDTPMQAIDVDRIVLLANTSDEKN